MSRERGEIEHSNSQNVSLNIVQMSWAGVHHVVEEFVGPKVRKFESFWKAREY
jgi:hypothetical protein